MLRPCRSQRRSDLRIMGMTAMSEQVTTQEICTTHFTNFGVQNQPEIADNQGFLKYRDDFENKIPECEWTKQEQWINENCVRVINSRTITHFWINQSI